MQNNRKLITKTQIKQGESLYDYGKISTLLKI